MADIGWISLANAKDYFETRFNNENWNVLENEYKEAILTTAYDRIRYCNEFSIPISPTVAQKAKLADAQCEMAQYMTIHLADEDRRKGLQAQGVVGAGIVKENYVGHLASDDKMGLLKLPIPPIVYHILDEFKKYKSPLYMLDIDRDEDKSVDEDAVDV